MTGNYAVAAIVELPETSAEKPLPRESWFGIFLEDSRQKTRIVGCLFNPTWEKAPKAVKPVLLAWENNGNMQQSAGGETVELSGRLQLKAEVNEGQIFLALGKTREQPHTVVSRPMPEGFSPNRIGITVDCYHAEPVAPVKFESFAVTSGKGKRLYRFTAGETWQRNSGRGVVQYGEALRAIPVRMPENLSGKANVVSCGIPVDGKADIAPALRKLFDGGVRRLYFPKGVYPIGKLEIPEKAVLHFAPGAVWQVLGSTGSVMLNGSDITLKGIIFDLNGTDADYLISANGCSNLRFLNCSTISWQGKENSREKLPERAPNLFELENCSDILLADGKFADLADVLHTSYCSRITVRSNRAERCGSIVNASHGSEFLNHHDNWSRNVRFQCMWWGGDSNDQKLEVLRNSARIVKRGIRPGEAGFHVDTAGAYDVQIHDNFAEYGTTLAWGSKGRNVVISGNIARYMEDMAYDTEGGENVVISNNISINSACAGIGCYFYGERILIANNQVLVFEEGNPVERGNFLRLHSGGPGDHFGNGQIMITGNQFIAETKKERQIAIETAREVYISGNTFRNGRIVAGGNAERVTITGNFFENLLIPGGPAVVLGGGIEHRLKDNTFRLTRAAGTTPAVSFAGESTCVFVTGNSFSGWKNAADVSGGAGTLFFLNNILDGQNISSGSWKVVDENNCRYSKGEIR